MKIALVHELLTMKGGAERVLKVFADMFPDAPIFTFLHDNKAIGDWFPPERVSVSRLQRFAKISKNHHLYLPWFPKAAEEWDFSEFDLVISSSSAFAHGIITNGHPKHLCYVHSPARYLWDRTHEILEGAAKGPIGPLRFHVASLLFHKLRTWDAEAADRPDMLLAASQTVQRRIELYWRRESEVLHPPIRDFWFEELGTRSQTQASEYYLIVSTLSDYKRIDLAIRAANDGKFNLKIAGTGRAEKYLKSIAGPTVEFLGYQQDAQLRDLYANAKATIFPGDEDFGLVPLESQACGTPVIAFRSGGALETVEEGRTGEFFDEPTPPSLLQAIQKFEQQKYSKETCVLHARKFRESEFVQKMHAYIHQLTKG
jgi:glycosyltransferase involved in cell wall biosynthesis